MDIRKSDKVDTADRKETKMDVQTNKTSNKKKIAIVSVLACLALLIGMVATGTPNLSEANTTKETVTQTKKATKGSKAADTATTTEDTTIEAENGSQEATTQTAAENKADAKKSSGSTSTKSEKKSSSSSSTSKSETKKSSSTTALSSKSAANSSTSSTTAKSESKAASHTHNWVAITQTVHHDAVTHEEPVYEKRAYCWTSDGREFSTQAEAVNHANEVLDATGEFVRSGVGYRTIQTGTKTVVDHAAYDETVTTGYKCSSCGATR